MHDVQRCVMRVALALVLFRHPAVVSIELTAQNKLKKSQPGGTSIELCITLTQHTFTNNCDIRIQ